jgi:RimJ/RimL family protein N-acetyltransferase
MKQSDVDAMIRMRPFADPLYQPFDFPRGNRAEQIRWFNWRNDDSNRRLYAVENEAGQVVGSLTLREIDGQRSARLGITLGADFVSHGYGSEALQLFLDHFFEEMSFARMVLDVAATNLRAVRTYRALGFREIGRHYRPASHRSYRTVRHDPRYRHLRRYFKRQGGFHQVLFYDMVLTREEWLAWREERRAISKDRV